MRRYRSVKLHCEALQQINIYAFEVSNGTSPIYVIESSDAVNPLDYIEDILVNLPYLYKSCVYIDMSRFYGVNSDTWLYKLQIKFNQDHDFHDYDVAYGDDLRNVQDPEYTVIRNYIKERFASPYKC